MPINDGRIADCLTSCTSFTFAVDDCRPMYGFRAGDTRITRLNVHQHCVQVSCHIPPSSGKSSTAPMQATMPPPPKTLSIAVLLASALMQCTCGVLERGSFSVSAEAAISRAGQVYSVQFPSTICSLVYLFDLKSSTSFPDTIVIFRVLPDRRNDTASLKMKFRDGRFV